MKRMLGMLLALLLALGACTAVAENANGGKVEIGTISINGMFTLKCGLPEGYRVETIYEGPEQVIAALLHEDPAKPSMMLSVAFDETYADVERMNDLDEEAMDLLEKTFTDVDPTVEISYGDTGLGTRLLIAKQTEGEQDYIDFLSVYKGYFVEFVMVASEQAEDKNLTDEQLQLCIDFLTDLDFVPGDMPVVTGAADLAGTTVLARLTNYDAEANTLQAELKRTLVLNPEVVAALQVGDTLVLGEQQEVIESLEPDEEDGSILVNDEIWLFPREDGVHASMYEHEYTETIALLTLEVPEDLVFIDGIDPETGDVLEEPAEHTAAEFIAQLSAGGYPDFASDNVNVTFDAEGRMTKVERFYTPWQ